MTRQAPRIPYVSNLTGTWMTAEQATDPAYWARHLREPVRFARGSAELLREPARVLLEVGPGTTLSGLGGPAAAARARAAWRCRSLRAPEEPQRTMAFLLQALGGCGWRAWTWTGRRSTRASAAGVCRCRPIRSSASATGSNAQRAGRRACGGIAATSAPTSARLVLRAVLEALAGARLGPATAGPLAGVLRCVGPGRASRAAARERRPGRGQRGCGRGLRW